MNNSLKEHIEKFLDDFMFIQYKGKDHIIARQFFRETFNDLIPKYFEPKQHNSEIKSTDLNDDTILKNIVVIGAGYGGLTASLRLAKLLRKHPFFKVHLIDKYPYHTIKTQLHEAAVRKAEVSIPLYKILKN
mgnify:FL=1